MAQDTSPEYERARARVEKKRKFRSDVVAYVVVNAFLVGVWALTGAGYFWPGLIMAAWGMGLTLAGWDLFYRRDVTDEDVQRELRKGR